MNKVCARHETLPYQIEFPSPVYTSAILGAREDIVVGVGGGKRFGMPNIIVAIEQLPHDPKLCWNVCSWLDLGDDIPWSGAKVPMQFAEDGSHKEYLQMSHLDSISIIEYEKNLKFDPKLLAAEEEERKKQPQEKLGKRDSPLPPKNTPVFLRRVARLPLRTDAENPDKKVACILRSSPNGGGALPKRLTDQLMFVCQDDSSVVMFRLKKRIKKEEEEKGKDNNSNSNGDTFDYDVYTYTIPSNELRMGKAHPTDMDACETSSGIVLMIVCDDKKVRCAFLPQAWHCLNLCTQKAAPAGVSDDAKGAEGAAAADGSRATKDEATEEKGGGSVKEEDGGAKQKGTSSRVAVPLKPLAVVVRSLLVLTPEDLRIPFAVMRSTLRVGLVMDPTTSTSNNKNGKTEGSSNKEVLPAAESVILLVMAYDRDKGTTNTVMAKVAIEDACVVTRADTPCVAPVCAGAVTNLMPLYDSLASCAGGARPMPERWLATTVEGTIVELKRTDDDIIRAGNADLSGGGGVVSSSSSSAAAPFPLYTTAHQRPYAPKRCPPHLGAVHQEPISSAAISPKSGLLVTVDIAQKARLSRMEDLPTIVGVGDANSVDATEKVGPPAGGIPFLFPVKKSKSSSASASSSSALAAASTLMYAIVALSMLALAVAVAFFGVSARGLVNDVADALTTMFVGGGGDSASLSSSSFGSGGLHAHGGAGGEGGDSAEGFATGMGVPRR